MEDSDTNDIYEDLEATPNANPSGEILLEEDSSSEAESSDLWIVKEIITNPKETELKKTENKLLLEIVKAEQEKRKEEKMRVSDYNEIKKQLLHLQKLNAEKDDQIAFLKKKHSNLEMNICSLYKTTKSESTQKDLLLKEANEKIDSLLYKRNLPKDYFEKQSLQTLCPKCNKSSQDKSKEDKVGQGASSEHSSVTKSPDVKDGNSKESSGQLKRSRSSSSDPENPKTETNSHSNKRQNCELNDIRDVTQSTNKKGLDQNQKCDSKIIQDCSQNSTPLTNSENLNKKKNCDLNSLQNTVDNDEILLQPINDDCINKTTPVQPENMDQQQSADLASGHTQAVDNDQEPSVQELFFQMQAMIDHDPETLNDPDIINLIFDNLLPDQLKQWFVEYETSQMSALNKLKKSFVSSYFQQCSSKLPSEKSVKPQNFSFFFPQNSSSKSDCDVSPSASDAVSDVNKKPQDSIKEKEEIIILSSGKEAKNIKIKVDK